MGQDAPQAALVRQLRGITGVIVLTTIVTIAGALHHPDARGDLTLGQLAQASGLSQGLTQSGVLLGAVSFSIAAFQFGGSSPTGHCATCSFVNREEACSWPASASRC